MSGTVRSNRASLGGVFGIAKRVLATGAGGFVGAIVAGRVLKTDFAEELIPTDRAMHSRIETLADCKNTVEAGLQSLQVLDTDRHHFQNRAGIGMNIPIRQ